jgi:hypothetical protein
MEPQFLGSLLVTAIVYLLGIIHLGTVIVTFPRIINPFAFPEGGPPNFLFFGGIPILAAIIALILQGNGALSVEGDKQS